MYVYVNLVRLPKSVLLDLVCVVKVVKRSPYPASIDVKALKINPDTPILNKYKPGHKMSLVYKAIISYQ